MLSVSLSVVRLQGLSTLLESSFRTGSVTEGEGLLPNLKAVIISTTPARSLFKKTQGLCHIIVNTYMCKCMYERVINSIRAV